MEQARGTFIKVDKIVNTGDYTMPVMFAAASAVAGSNIAIVIRLRALRGGAFDALGRPSAFHFAGFQWMLKRQFVTWLWSPSHRTLVDQKLTRQNFSAQALLAHLLLCLSSVLRPSMTY